MRCEGDVFKFDQYAGCLDCKGNGIAQPKVMTTKCELDVPDDLSVLGLDLCFCGSNTAGCSSGNVDKNPTVTAGSDPVYIYLNNEICDSTSTSTFFLQTKSSKGNSWIDRVNTKLIEIKGYKMK